MTRCIFNISGTSGMKTTLYYFQLSIAVILVLFSFVININAQSAGATTGSIIGTITDQGSAVIDGATIIVKNLQTNQTRTTLTSNDGSYIIPQLLPGDYEVMVQVDGFATQTFKLELVLGNTALANFKLTIGAKEDVIEVKDTTIVNFGSTESSNNINKQFIENLPINQRNFLDFALTTARVTRDRVPTQGASATSGLSFNGQPSRFNNVTVDGLDNNEVGSGSVRSTFSQDAIQEFQIITNNYSAEFGRALGGAISIITRGGSNDLHGGIFLFNRNESTSSRDAFAPTKPPFSQYQFGATLNGAIKKERAFYFLSFERLSVKQSNIVTVSDTVIKALNQNGFPARNGAIPFSIGSSIGFSKLDLKLSSKDNLSVRFNFAETYNGSLEPFGGLIIESNGGLQRLSDKFIAVNNTYIKPESNLVNETRFLFSRRDQSVEPLSLRPLVRLGAQEGIVTFGRGTFLPQTRLTDLYQIVNITSVNKGRNQLKFGIDFNYLVRNGEKSRVPLFSGGAAFFSAIDFAAILNNPALPFFTALQAFDPNQRTPQQLAFLSAVAVQLPNIAPPFPRNVPLAQLSLPIAYAQGFGTPGIGVSTGAFAAFVQDDIRLKPNLILKLGARYDRIKVPFAPSNSGNIAPRVSLAYQPKPNLNIRAAYGLFYSQQITGQSILIETVRNGLYKTVISPFPFSVLPFSLPNNQFPESTELPSNIIAPPQLSQSTRYADDLRNSYTQQSLLGIDYILNQSTSIGLEYTFIRGVKLFASRDINPIVRPLNDPVMSAITGRIDTTVGDVFQFESAFDSYYHGATFFINRRFSKNLNLNAHYSLSKSIDNFTDVRPDLQEIQDPLNIGAERGLSLQDVRSRFVTSAVWDLNYGNNILLKNYRLSTIITLESGRPYNLLTGEDTNRNGDAFQPGDRPLGMGRNSGITPGFANVDLRLSRNISINERFSTTLNIELFNVFNRTNINEIARIFTPDKNGNFKLPSLDNGRFIAEKSQYRSAFAPRQIQFSFRISF
ncbi:MAG: TonB-dependent receptor [Acidobacteria bacterium]|nr:TonB-dependent receptor [Acidobacteriota bacterium]